MLVQLIADYGFGDLAFAEVRQRLAGYLPQADVVHLPVPAFDSLGAGFCVGQLALTDGPPDRIVYHNVAPRADDTDPRRGNEGERLLAAWLPTGVLVFGVDSRYAFSFLRDEVDEIRTVAIPESGSQFRSRDVFPALLSSLVAGDRSSLGDPVPAEQITTPPERSLLYVDGYGNLKTSWTTAPAAAGTRVEVRVGDRQVTALVSDGTFAVEAGQTAFAPGSSGWRRRDGSQLTFYELLTRGGSAAALLGDPPAGTPVEVLGPD